MIKSSKQYRRNIIAALALVLGLTIPSAKPLAQSGTNPQIVPPNARPYGLTYGQWSARHWRWTYSLPADHHPLTDTADCSAGQTGPVWFLGGTFAANPTGPNTVVGSANRSCAIPRGKALFFPIFSAEGSEVEGNGTTEQEFRDFAKYLMDHAVNLEATVDGVTVQNLQNYRVQSPLFAFGPLPDNNLLGAPTGTVSPAVADGFYLMLAPLSAGSHTIHFAGAVVFTQAQDGFDFTFALDITYNLSVLP